MSVGTRNHGGGSPPSDARAPRLHPPSNFHCRRRRRQTQIKRPHPHPESRVDPPLSSVEAATKLYSAGVRAFTCACVAAFYLNCPRPTDLNDRAGKSWFRRSGGDDGASVVNPNLSKLHFDRELQSSIRPSGHPARIVGSIKECPQSYSNGLSPPPPNPPNSCSPR